MKVLMRKVLCVLLVLVQLKYTTQQLTFARSWVRGEFANDEEGGGPNNDYDPNLRSSQDKKANRGFYVRNQPWIPEQPEITKAEPISKSNSYSGTRTALNVNSPTDEKSFYHFLQNLENYFRFQPRIQRYNNHLRSMRHPHVYK